MPDFSLAEGRKVVGDFAVYPNSLLFTAGRYDDKNLTMTEGDIAAAAEGFVPVEFNVEHAKHGAHQALAGAFGGILKSWVDTANPKNLRGEVAIPLWLDERLETKAPSLEFTIADKRICGAALTYKPRVAEAAFMSAIAEFASKADFANTRHNTPEGQTVMQNLHDTAARAGAICDKKNAEMSSQHEATAIQKIHDMAADHGASCSKGEAPAWAKSMFSIIHPASIIHQAETDPARHSRQGEKPMPEATPWYARLIPSLKKAGATEEDIHASFAEMPASTSGLTESEKAEFSNLRAANARLLADGIAAQAETFACAQVAAGRILPYEKADLIAQFSQAAADDAAVPVTVTFSTYEEGKEVQKTGGRLERLKAVTERRPSSGMLQEMTGHGRQLGEADFRALFNRDSASETPDEKRARIEKAADEERKKHGLPAKSK